MLPLLWTGQNDQGGHSSCFQGSAKNPVLCQFVLKHPAYSFRRNKLDVFFHTLLKFNLHHVKIIFILLALFRIVYPSSVALGCLSLNWFFSSPKISCWRGGFVQLRRKRKFGLGQPYVYRLMLATKRKKNPMQINEKNTSCSKSSVNQLTKEWGSKCHRHSSHCLRKPCRSLLFWNSNKLMFQEKQNINSIKKL